MTDLISRSHPLLDRILVLLMPFFAGTDRRLVAAAALETLGDYMPATRAELLHAAQIIAFSMSALDSLSEAVSLELPTTLRMRLRGGANALNRSAMQTMRALDRCQAAAAAEDPPPAEPVSAPPPAEPAKATTPAEPAATAPEAAPAVAPRAAAVPPVALPAAPVAAPRVPPAAARHPQPPAAQSVISDAENKRIWAQALREVAEDLVPAADEPALAT